MKLITVAATIIISVGAHAQTAKVIALSPEDAKMAQELDAEQKALTLRANNFHERVRLKYIGGIPSGVVEFVRICGFEAECPGQKHNYPYPKPGWDYGFEFSEDWKYIVPNPIPRYQKTFDISNGCSYVTTPAIGTWQ